VVSTAAAGEFSDHEVAVSRTDSRRTTIIAFGCTDGQAGFSCNSSGMIITPAGWQLETGFIARE
jgi:hypothetical protein